MIGPPGVFTRNTKNHRGKHVNIFGNVICVGGWQQPYIAKSKAEGESATRLLSTARNFPVPVEPILVILTNRLSFRSRPSVVSVVGAKQVAKWLESRPHALRPVRLRQSTTWHVIDPLGSHRFVSPNKYRHGQSEFSKSLHLEEKDTALVVNALINAPPVNN